MSKIFSRNTFGQRTHLVQRLAHIFLELIPQAVKLKTDGFSWDGFPGAGPGGATEYRTWKYDSKFHTRDPVLKSV